MLQMKLDRQRTDRTLSRTDGLVGGPSYTPFEPIELAPEEMV